MTLRRLSQALFLVAALALAACGAPPPGGPEAANPAEVARLASAVASFGPGVDEAEAARLAQIAHDYPRQLAREYNVTDPPLVHNTKVNLGLRDRGLCYQWADDIEARLRQEGFETLEFHRAIANDYSIRIGHSVVIVSRRGDPMHQGIVLDGWRNGGRLFWSRTTEDPRYEWVPRDVVFEQRRQRERRR